MNEEAENLERRLQRQPLKKIPREWRAEILSVTATSTAPRPTPRASRLNFLSTIHHQFSTIFWPHPKAWAGLAAVWVFIFALNFSTRDTTPRLAQKSAPPSPEVIVELKKQQRMFAELAGSYEALDADRRTIFSPKPRSGRVEILAA